MNIELRNIKHAAFASQETNCFSATVYIDGQKAGTVENDGHGGSDNIHPHSLRERLDAYGKTLPPLPFKGGDEQHTLPMDAELIIDDLLQTYIAERHLKRLMKARLLYTKPGKKGIWQTGKLAPDVLARKVEECRALVAAGKPLPGAEQCLNNLPLAEAVKLYRGAA